MLKCSRWDKKDYIWLLVLWYISRALASLQIKNSYFNFFHLQNIWTVTFLSLCALIHITLDHKFLTKRNYLHDKYEEFPTIIDLPKSSTWKIKPSYCSDHAHAVGCHIKQLTRLSNTVSYGTLWKAQETTASAHKRCLFHPTRNLHSKSAFYNAGLLMPHIHLLTSSKRDASLFRSN